MQLALRVKDTVWLRYINDEEKMFDLGTIVRLVDDSTSFCVSLENGEEIIACRSQLQLVKTTPDYLQDDLLELGDFCEEGIVYSLKERHTHGKIYT